MVRDGFTHHPQALQERRYFPGDRTMPSRIVIIDAKGFLTLDAISWLADRGIPIIQLDWRGRVIVSINNPQSVSQTRIRAQIESQKHALRTASALIEAKFLNCVRTLHVLPDSPHKTRAIDAHHHEIAALKKSPPKTIGRLLGIEGSTAQRYFAAWQAIPFRWKGLNSRPIPADWHSFIQRTSQLGKKGENIGASHPINAMLNYAYAILESNVRIETILDGFDPSIGYLHLEEERRSSFVFDLMEPLRPLVDRIVIDFITAQTFERSDFDIAKNGVCRLNPELARSLVRHVQTTIGDGMIGPERSRGQPNALTKGLYEAISFQPRIS